MSVVDRKLGFENLLLEVRREEHCDLVTERKSLVEFNVASQSELRAGLKNLDLKPEGIDN